MNKFLLRIWHRTQRFYHTHHVLCLIGVIIVVTYLVIRLFFTAPLLSDTSFGNAYYDRTGRLMRITLTPDDKYRLYTPLSEISPYLRNATILYEDKHFRYHFGVNPISLARATINWAMGRPHPAGASTITMQVARIKYDLNTTTPTGKLIQIAAAIYIDAFHSKDEILQAYLNLAPYGGNIESVGAASAIYFGKTADKLSKIESITLSTIPQNPTKRGLNTDLGQANLQKMRGDLIRRWVHFYPNDTDLMTFADMPLHATRTSDLPFIAPHFTDRMNTKYSAHHGQHTSTYITTIDASLQHALEKRLRSEIATRTSRGIENAAAILVNYKTMETLAYIGSADYFNNQIGGQNDGVNSRRSPGSTLKPLIYTAASDAGLIHPMTLLKDAKINFGVYAPENSDSEFYGPVLARDALTHSRNIPAINLVRQIGIRNFYRLLTLSGVSGLKSPGYYGVSIALGGAEVSMTELANIYATMANLGMRYNIRTIMDAPQDVGEQLLSPEAFFLTLDMLGRQSVPTRRIPFAKNQPTPLRHYWKTGTSSSFRDAWTAGIFGDFVLIVWVGNFDGRPNNAFSGAKTAAPIYFALADTVRHHYASQGITIKNNNFMRDDLNISQIDMCESVGGIAGAHCPHSIKSYFIPGKSPIDVSSVYRAIPIDNKSGLRACNANPATTHMVVYEFWDAEYLDLFKRAGIKRNTPPPFMPGCNLDDVSNDITPPIIISPADGAKIVIVSTNDWANVSFQALSEYSDTKIFWMLDDDIIGTSAPGETFTYHVPMGEHTVRAIDEMGAGRSIDFAVVK
ncbi:MAG: penicillin-binding protein 1C [Alphaproteobacteria bacterium]|nr:penicillin-binding protein 1C [Alphaproteobacteria bacterium]